MSESSDRKGCPSSEELRNYGQGRLPDARSREIESHLDSGCAVCNQRIATVEAEDDDLLTSFRHAGNVEPVPESALERLRTALTDVAGAGLADAAGLGLLAGEGGRIHIEEGDPVWSGGNGRISIAVDMEIGRPVALKQPVTPNDIGSGRREQILREAKITGSLEHRGIVPIHGLGLDGHGHPCFAMRLIRGVTLKTVIRRFHEGESLEAILDRGAQFDDVRHPPARDSQKEQAASSDTTSRTARDLRELFRRFRDVCDVLTYAHNRLVVHLDVKPSNIMLGRYGETFVLDWGHACRMEGPGPEKFPPGTIGYRSPEQATARLDRLGPACDVYSLGATLCQLLTGRPPLEDAERGPFRPEEIKVPRAALPNDARPLAAIVNRAMSSEPGERYSSPSELADALDHWLADEAVPGWREPVTIRARRWLRRHRTLVTAVAAVLLFGLAGLAGFAAVLAGKNRELLHERNRAEQREALAIAAVKKFRDAVQSNPELKNRSELESLREALLKEPLGFFRQLRDQLQADHDPQLDALERLADASIDLAATLAEIGDVSDAIREYTEAIPLWDRLVGERPNVPSLRRNLALCCNNLGLLLRDTGKLSESQEAHQHALDIRERLVHDNADDAKDRSHLATSYNNLAIVLKDMGRTEEALATHRHGLDIRERLARENPAVDEFAVDRAASYNNIAELLRSTVKKPESLEMYRRSLEIKERLVREKPANHEYQRDLAVGLDNLGLLLSQTGKPAEAIKAAKRALTIREWLARENPAVTQYQNELATSHLAVGNLLTNAGQAAEALSEYRLVTTIRERMAESNPSVTQFWRDLAASHNNVGYLLSAMNQKPEALAAYRRAAGILERLSHDSPTTIPFQRDLAAIHDNIGILLGETADLAGALTSYQRALEIRERLSRDDPTVLDHQSDLATT